MMVNYCLIFVSLLLFAGLAVDAGMLERSYIQLQGGAQAAAMAGSIALQRGGSSSTITSAGQAVAGFNGFTNGSNGVTVTIQNPPAAGTYANNSLAVLATVTKTVPTTFLGILGMGKVNMKAQALQLAPTIVSLSSAANVIAIYKDSATIPSNGGFDGQGYAYSADALGQVRSSNNLGALQSWRGNIFYFGPPNVSNAVSNATINLPHASYSQILILAGAVNGPLSSEPFVVKYSDSSSTTATFDMSDWCSASFYSGETLVSQTPYRDQSPSGTQYGTINVYGYSINLDSSKTVMTLKPPSTRQVVVLAIDLRQ
jgi:hypothetical protein